MTARGREEAPSPLLFLAALPLALLVAVGALLLLPDKPDETIEYAEGPAGMRSGPGERPFRVVAIGTSLIQSAADPGAVEAFSAARGHAVRFRRVTCVGRHVEWVEPFLAELAKDPPDLLVVEAELLAWLVEPPAGTVEEPERPRRPRNAPKGGLALLRHRRGFASSWLVGEMRRAVGLGVEVVRSAGGPDPLRYADDVADLLGALGSGAPDFEAARYARHLARVRLRDLDALGGILGALDALKGRGCRVVLLSMGRSPAADALFPARLSRDFAGFLDRLSERGFAVERGGPRLEQRHYVDAAHLDSVGRSRYSEWLAGRIPLWGEGR